MRVFPVRAGRVPLAVAAVSAAVALGIAMASAAAQSSLRFEPTQNPSATLLTIQVEIASADEAEAVCRAACAAQKSDWVNLFLADSPQPKTALCQCRRSLAAPLATNPANPVARQ